MSINWWMDEWKKMWFTYNGILLGNEKEWNPAICSNVDGTGRYYAEWNKSVTEGQISYVFTHTWILRNLTEDHGRREGEKNGYKQRGREADYRRLLTTENKVKVDGGLGERGEWVMGIEEGTCWDEPWVLYVSDGPPGIYPQNQEHTLHTAC